MALHISNRFHSKPFCTCSTHLNSLADKPAREKAEVPADALGERLLQRLQVDGRGVREGPAEAEHGPRAGARHGGGAVPVLLRRLRAGAARRDWLLHSKCGLLTPRRTTPYCSLQIIEQFEDALAIPKLQVIIDRIECVQTKHEISILTPATGHFGIKRGACFTWYA